MAIQLQTKSDEISKSKDEMRDLTSKLNAKLEVSFNYIISSKQNYLELILNSTFFNHAIFQFLNHFQEKELEIKNMEKEVSDMTAHIDECETTLSEVEPENEKLKKDLEDLHEQTKRSIAEASENAEEEIRCLKVNLVYWSQTDID